MLPFLVLLATKGPIDGETAVGIAGRFLLQMGVPKSIELKSVGPQSASAWRIPKGKVWAVSFGLSGESGFSVVLDESGTVHYASRYGPTRGEAGRSVAAEYGRRLMARVPSAFPVRQDSLDTSQFHLVFQRRIYFNVNPTYGYQVQFDKDGALTWFGRFDNPPRPIATVPRIGLEAAVAKLTPLVERPQGRNRRFPRFVETELGYYVRKGESKARLVYRGSVVSLTHGYRSELGPLNTFVDAKTGETFRADDR